MRSVAHTLLKFRNLALLVTGITCWQIACASRTLNPPVPQLAFENGSSDVVHIFVKVGESENWLGRVDANGRTVLSLPAGLWSRQQLDSRLIVVPVRGPVASQPTSNSSLAIESSTHSLSTLLERTWRYTGNVVISPGAR